MSGVPDINDPEVRSQVFNFMLGINEANGNLKQMARVLRKTSFDQLTPEFWAQVVAQMDTVDIVTEFLTNSMKEAGYFMDNQPIMDEVQKRVLQEIESEKDT